MYVGKYLTMGAIIRSKQLEMSSVGQLQAETTGRPGLSGLWILGLKLIHNVLGVDQNELVYLNND